MITKRERLRVAKPVVLIAEELSPATVGVLGSDFDIRHCDGANRDELLAALKSGVDAVLIRSATKMDAEAISAATGLRVIARAGVGLDMVMAFVVVSYGTPIVSTFDPSNYMG